MPVPTFQNLGFESAGAEPGTALGWLHSFQSSAEEIAGFTPAPDRPQEDFERGWVGNEEFLFALAPTSVEPALFDTVQESGEDFEEDWSDNESFLFELGSIAAADYAPGASTKLMEDFDGFWVANESFLFSFSPANLFAAPTEAFEAGWKSNQSFVFTFAPPNLSAASYDAVGTPEPLEDFEELWPNVRMTTV